MSGVLPALVCFCLSAAVVVSQAGQAPAADVADALTKARTVAVVGMTGKQMMFRGWANPNGPRAKEKVEAVLTDWGRYKIVEAANDADLVLVVVEYQKNLSLIRRANLVAELRVYRAAAEITETTPTLWTGDAAEGFKKLPATKVAEEFREFVKKLSTSSGDAR